MAGGLVAAGLVLLLSGPQSRAEQDIVLGLSVAMSGPMAAYDDNGAKTTQVFIDDVNAKGGLLGRKLRAVIADTKSDRAEGAKAGQEVVRQGADVVWGTCDYDYGAPAALQGQKAGKVTVFMCAEDPKAGVAGIGPFSFTSSIAAQVQGAVFGEWGYEKKGWRTEVSPERFRGGRREIQPLCVRRRRAGLERIRARQRHSARAGWPDG